MSRVLFPPRGNAQDILLEAFTRGLTEYQKREPPVLPENCGHRKEYGSGRLESSISQTQKR